MSARTPACFAVSPTSPSVAGRGGRVRSTAWPCGPRTHRLQPGRLEMHTASRNRWGRGKSSAGATRRRLARSGCGERPWPLRLDPAPNRRFRYGPAHTSPRIANLAVIQLVKDRDPEAWRSRWPRDPTESTAKR